MIYVVLIIAWYVIGVLGMLTLQRMMDSIDDKQAIGSQEIFVLGLCGPIVFLTIGFSFLGLMWLMYTDDKKSDTKSK